MGSLSNLIAMANEVDDKNKLKYPDLYKALGSLADLYWEAQTMLKCKDEPRCWEEEKRKREERDKGSGVSNFVLR